MVGQSSLCRGALVLAVWLGSLGCGVSEDLRACRSERLGLKAAETAMDSLYKRNVDRGSPTYAAAAERARTARSHLQRCDDRLAAAR